MDDKLKARLEMQIIEMCKSVYDPEIPVNVYDLGLIYNIDIQDDSVAIDMTLTSVTCPMADQILNDLKEKVSRIPKITGVVTVNLVWEPQWNHDMLTDAAKLELGIF